MIYLFGVTAAVVLLVGIDLFYNHEPSSTRRTICWSLYTMAVVILVFAAIVKWWPSDPYGKDLEVIYLDAAPTSAPAGGRLVPDTPE